MSSLLVRPHTTIQRGINALDGCAPARVDRALSALAGALHRLSAVVRRGDAGRAAAERSCLFKLVPRELAPTEDRGSFSVSVTGPEGAGFDYTVSRCSKVEQIDAARRSAATSRHAHAQPHAGRLRRARKHEQRPRDRDPQALGRARASARDDVVEQVRRELAKIPGVRAIPQTRPGPGAQQRAAAAGRAGRAGLRGSWCSGAIACWRAWSRTPACTAPMRTTRKPGRSCT